MVPLAPGSVTAYNANVRWVLPGIGNSSTSLVRPQLHGADDADATPIDEKERSHSDLGYARGVWGRQRNLQRYSAAGRVRNP